MNMTSFIMNQRAYAFNRDAAYKAGALFAPGTPGKLQIAGPLEIVCSNLSESAKFTARVPDIFGKYKLPYVSSDHVVDLWSSLPMQFWQNQLNFAVWCSTTGCGVSASHWDLSRTEPLSRALYLFHVYFTTRRILKELGVALPQDQSWNAFDNTYDRRAYERLCNSFGVSPNTNWRVGGPTQGLGRAYNYYTYDTYHPVNTADGGSYNPARMSFTKETTNEVLHIDYVAQDSPDADTAWTRLILDKGEGFTHEGVNRINDSIRTYVWAILGAQSQIRTNILGTGAAFGAQDQFVKNLEVAISAPEDDRPSSIEHYQAVLRYARSKVDFVFGYDLYMAPSDMQLRIGQIEWYNNLVVTATKDMRLGSNVDVNGAPVPPAAPPIREPMPAHHEPEPKSITVPPPTVSPEDKIASEQHENDKTALIVGGVAVGLLILLWTFRP